MDIMGSKYDSLITLYKVMAGKLIVQSLTKNSGEQVRVVRMTTRLYIQAFVIRENFEWLLP